MVRALELNSPPCLLGYLITANKLLGSVSFSIFFARACMPPMPLDDSSDKVFSNLLPILLSSLTTAKNCSKYFGLDGLLLRAFLRLAITGDNSCNTSSFRLRRRAVLLCPIMIVLRFILFIARSIYFSYSSAFKGVISTGEVRCLLTTLRNSVSPYDENNV